MPASALVVSKPGVVSLEPQARPAPARARC